MARQPIRWFGPRLDGTPHRNRNAFHRCHLWTMGYMYQQRRKRPDIRCPERRMRLQYNNNANSMAEAPMASCHLDVYSLKFISVPRRSVENQWTRCSEFSKGNRPLPG